MASVSIRCTPTPSSTRRCGPTNSLPIRAARYGLTIDEYKRRNLMSIEITSADVAGVVAATLGPIFSCVTGAHIPIDGGNDRVI